MTLLEMTQLGRNRPGCFVRTADGEQGWLQDPEEFQYDEESRPLRLFQGSSLCRVK